MHKMGGTIRVLSGHAHWVNALALSTAHVLRTGPFDHTGQRPDGDTESQDVCSALVTAILTACTLKRSLSDSCPRHAECT